MAPANTQMLHSGGSRYDVYLSRTSEDTRSSFTSYLYSTLSNTGITVFEDDTELSRGNVISIELLRSIEGCKISIIVFSNDYAGSKWRLEELSKIMEIHRTKGGVVLPLFYGVDRLEVRHQSSSFGEAFQDLMQRISPAKDEVPRWRRALREAAAIAGFVVPNSNSNGQDIIEDIVEHVCYILDEKKLFVTDYPVGLNYRVQDVITMLQKRQSDDVILLGIFGMDGVGKTTIAKAIYNEIGCTFDGRSFLSNIGNIWEQDNGPVSLQNKLLSDVITIGETINSLVSGKMILSHRLHQMRALVVLDDVNHIVQLDALCGSREWFGLGSRIIITTRSQHLLKSLGVDIVYHVKGMDKNESFELFSWHAFKQVNHESDFNELSSQVISCCGGLPLVLEIIGSYLFDRETSEWMNVLEKLRRCRHHGIFEKLKICFEGLSDESKLVFIDIACSFIGRARNDVTQMLNDRGFSADNGISVLKERRLVTIDKNNKLSMHPLVQEVGRYIDQSSHEEPAVQGHSQRYDVFLSFRGEDTRATFTSHLYSSLTNAGVIAFKDDAELPKGKSVSIELLRGIENSKILIIIFSREYSSSRWCLEELSKIMELHESYDHVILPVFYRVDPSEIRRQTSSFGEAFEDLMHRISPTEDQILKWRTALHKAGGIAGFVVLDSRNESEDIKNIVKHVCSILDKKDLFIANHPVGVNSRMQDVIQISDSCQSKGVLLIGVWGMGGIGKTTIAKAIYNEIGRTFESRSFLSNIREIWEQDNGQVCLQNQLLFHVCKTPNVKIDNIESGKCILRDRLCHKKALVVLDDVDKLDQLNALVGSREWFGSGSRIIITTRNKHLLNVLQVDHVYGMTNMGERESIELFSWHAFKQESPKEDFIELSKNIVAYSGGLPLALEVLGSYLFDREVTGWESVLEKLNEIPDKDIQRKLRISFDGLSDDMEKEIFLDISCFLIGMDRNVVTQILNGCGFYANIGISVLVERSLVTIDEKNKLCMHDLLRDMGREIVREKSPKEPEERSRLWFHRDVVDLLSKHNGTKAVEGLALKLSHTEKVCFYTKAFKKMKRLRLLCLDNVQLEGDFEYVSRNLKWLSWNGFPFKYTPNNFYQKDLVAIDLKYSKLRQVWKEPQLLERLKFLNLSHSLYLVHTPDFSTLPNLEKLILKTCPSLSMIHHTIGLLDKLLLLNLKDCSGLRSLPRSIYKLKCLKTLILSGCSMIEKLEEDIEQMDSLATLMADNTAITHVPYSLVRLKSIGYISLCDFQGLARDAFPSLIQSWMSPTNNPLPFIPSSSIPCNLTKQQSRGVTKIMDSLNATHCMDQIITPNTSKFSDIEPSVLANHQTQIHISRTENCLGHLLVQIGKNSQVISTLSESISQGFTLRENDDDCVLPGDKYPYWLTFKGEGASVKFKVPRVSGHDLKGMTLCCEYFRSGDLRNIAFESCVSLMIINYTKATTLLYKQDLMTFFEEAEWKEIISNLDLDDKVQVIAVFGNEFTVKKITVYLIYIESFDEQMEDPPSSPSRKMRREDKIHDFKFSDPRPQRVEMVQPQNHVKWSSSTGYSIIKFLFFLIFIPMLLSFLFYHFS